MAPPGAANALQGNRPRPSTARPIIPAIPLPYIQKRKQHAATPKKTEVVPISVPPADAPTTTSSPVTDIPPATVNGNADAIEEIEVGAELPPVIPATRSVEDNVEAPVGEVQETAEASLAG